MTDPSPTDPSFAPAPVPPAQPTQPTKPTPGHLDDPLGGTSGDAILDDDERDDEVDEVDELALLGESSGPPPWVGMVTTAGLGLAIITALDVIGTIAQGVAVNDATLTPELRDLGMIYRIGAVFLESFSRGMLGGLALLVALLLVCLPTIAGRTTSDRHDRAAALTIGVATAFAAIVMLGAVLAVASRLRINDLTDRVLDSRGQRELATFIVRQVGTGAIALLTGLAALRVRFAPPAAALLPAGGTDATYLDDSPTDSLS